MFEGLSKRLGDVFDRLRGRGALSEADVDAALREVRTALLEADVALPVVRDFVDEVRPKAIGADVIRSVTPGQMVIKIVNDHLVEMLGGTVADLDLNAIPPVVILMVGLQGSGKTTTSRQDRLSPEPGPAGHGGRVRRLLLGQAQGHDGLARHAPSRRPAAAQDAGRADRRRRRCRSCRSRCRSPSRGARSRQARREGFDVLILDTAGRLSIDEELMTEVKQISASSPSPRRRCSSPTP